jgi:PAS domain S-box-containing protein
MQDSDLPSSTSSELEWLRTENATLISKLALYEEKWFSQQKAFKQTSRIKEIIDQHSVYIITDPQGIMHYVNEGFCRLSLYSKEELIGKNANLVGSGYHPPAFWQGVWQTITQGRIWRGDVKNKAKDGTPFWIDMIIHPLLDEQEVIEGYLAIRKDITLSKQAQEKMQFDAHILAHVSDAVVGLDSSYRVNFWNQGAQRQYGLPSEQVMGKLLSEVYESIWIHPEDEPIAMQELAQSGSCKVEIIHRLRSGQQLYVEATTQVLLNESGEKAGLLAVIRDITDRKQAEKILTHTLEELQKRNHELDNYVYKVSHDLRAPLTSMQGLLNLIKAEPEGAVKEQYLALIENRLAKLDSYIQSILHHSKMVNAPLEIIPIEFNKIIKESFEELKHYTNWQKLKLSIHQPGVIPFHSDEFRVRLILRNIITNAIKYLNPVAQESYLHFDITITSIKASIRAEDNGIGIDDQYIEKIFDMFFRATDTSQGSGLGLYIVKEAVEKLQGGIRVESSKGKGTVFLIELPNLFSQHTGL